MGEQDIAASLRIARRELQLAVERHDDASAAILERAVIDLENLEHRLDRSHIVQLPASDEPPGRDADAATSQSDQVS
jgi:hypothetical protein